MKRSSTSLETLELEIIINSKEKSSLFYPIGTGVHAQCILPQGIRANHFNMYLLTNLLNAEEN